MRYTTSTSGEVSGASRTRMGAKPKAASPTTSAARTSIFGYFPGEPEGAWGAELFVEEELFMEEEVEAAIR
ncbi:hypothetical protein [Fodinibius roseus]|uniref:hypothetical protein n=1 Tax=Fodinibius roseus TaxID=1194090 RepID=UPI00147A4B1B|nr:hypothetical protein [Fodinibius roseus]